ncbi:LAME_0C06854g1_1 [Lachancea meyersii CBS 8951]|uniref:precorrin-2 dehydrogenase n=1 Tax=Lachancea meyersii CBS 8951 TaxID=1266667 RepID=A0A1G4J2U5_9SACH|nr:LAME_0C06854g1_1 [Lachancea meyersii CBS 8951]
MLSLQLAHQLYKKNVLLVGAGEVALTRIPKLLPTGCRLTVIAPEIHPDMWKYIDEEKDAQEKEFVDANWTPQKNKIYQILERRFEKRDLVLFGEQPDRRDHIDRYLNCDEEADILAPENPPNGWSLILTCIPDPILSERIYRGAKLVLGPNVLCNVADNPPLCDFYFGSNLTLGVHDADGNKPIQILISSNGNSPRFTALLKREIQNQYENLPIGKCVGKLGTLRSQIRQVSEKNRPLSLSQADLVKYRMNWIRECTDAFGVTHCHEIDVDKTVGLFTEMFASMSLNQPSREVFLQEYSKKEEQDT